MSRLIVDVNIRQAVPVLEVVYTARDTQQGLLQHCMCNTSAAKMQIHFGDRASDGRSSTRAVPLEKALRECCQDLVKRSTVTTTYTARAKNGVVYRVTA